MKKLYIYLLSIFLVMASAIVISYAWFANSKEVDPEITGYSKSAYFASGDGTVEKPFLITRNRHLYNLAWLQYLGQFNELETDGTTIKKQYYFKLGSDIDMAGTALPSIGTELHPFVGNFNGNGKVVTNLTVLNNYADFTVTPTLTSANNNNFGSIVGMFGVVGNLEDGDYTYDSDIVSISNFYIDNLSVRSSSQSTLIGLLAGYVNGNVTTVGIHYSNLSLIENATHLTTVENNTAVTNYGLIGYYNSKKVEWGDKPSSGQSFGTTLDVEGLYNRMEAIYKNNPSSNKTLEAVTSGYGLISGGYLSALPDGTGEINNDRDNAAPYNTGYYAGNDIKVYKESFPVGPDVVFHETTGSSGILNVVTDQVPDEIKDATIYNDSGSAFGIRLQSKIDTNNNLVTIQDGIVGSYRGIVKIPRRCIWFVPQQDGKLKFAIYAADAGANFALYEISRSTPGDYSSGMTGYTWIDGNSPRQTSLPKGNWYYYEYDAEAKTEYILANDRDTNGAYFCYLDIGMSSGSGDIESTIEKVDFVYAIEDEIGNITYSDFTVQSQVIFEITGTSTAVFNIYFRRKYFSEEEILVLYFIGNEPNGLNVKKLGSGSASKATDSDVDTKIS